MYTVNERIAKIREVFCNGSNKDFAKALNKTTNNTSNWTQQGYSVGRGVISDILRVFADVNDEWLLSGKGEMLKSNTEPSQSNDGSVTLPADVWELIKTQAESIKIKDRQTSDAINQTSEVIELLKDQLKKGQDVENSFRVANLVVVEDE